MRKSDFTLPTLDDLFSTQAERDDAKLERVRNIPLAELHPFKGHPFKVQNNEEMQRMIESHHPSAGKAATGRRLRADLRSPATGGVSGAGRRDDACHRPGAV